MTTHHTPRFPDDIPILTSHPGQSPDGGRIIIGESSAVNIQ